MTLPGPGNQLTMAQINAEFGYGFDLNAYRGKVWYYDNGTAGTFPDAPDPISFYDFYSKRRVTPVTPTTQIFTSSGNFTTPAVYTTMIVTVRGGGGGAGGYSGSINCGSTQGSTFGSDGSSGGTSSFGVFVNASGGSGGRGTGASGFSGSPASDGLPAGGLGIGGGGTGGTGGFDTVVLVSPSAGGSGPNPGATVVVTVGEGGVGGQGGPNSQLWSGVCTIIGYATRGQTGGSGSVTVEWS